MLWWFLKKNSKTLKNKSLIVCLVERKIENFKRNKKTHINKNVATLPKKMF